MAVSLEDFDDVLNETSLDLLGDSITYTPAGGSALSFKAIVDYADRVEQLSGTKMVVGENAVEVPIATVDVPTNEDEILLPKRAGVIYQPKGWIRDESGDNWLIVLKRKPV